MKIALYSIKNRKEIKLKERYKNKFIHKRIFKDGLQI